MQQIARNLTDAEQEGTIKNQGGRQMLNEPVTQFRDIAAYFGRLDCGQSG